MNCRVANVHSLLLRKYQSHFGSDVFATVIVPYSVYCGENLRALLPPNTRRPSNCFGKKLVELTMVLY